MSTPSSAGWYENPDNPEELRYFDGILWTKNTTPLRKRPHQGPPVVPPSSGPQQRPAGWGPQPHQQTSRPEPRSSSAVQTGLSGQPVLAPYGLRVVAYLIDTLIVGAVSLLLGGWFLWKSIEPVYDRFDTALAAGDIEAMSAAISEARLGYLAAFLGLQLVVLLAYQVFFLKRWSATPGKLAVGISVRRLDRPGPLDTDTAIRRAGFQAVVQALGNLPYASLLGTVLVVMDLVWPIADSQRQALHDKVAKTIVIKGKVQR
ncbi:RDD family protein [Knoellia sp. CPCC 206453]|uniref:RDD family protein n=1 Tax=Knoellia pratensis TaxID=3404796 RepID=UPI00361C3EBB